MPSIKINNQVEVLKFRAWLRIGGDPRQSSNHRQGTEYPVTGFTIQTQINGIPAASVSIATGVRLYDLETSAIHTEGVKGYTGTNRWPWARLYIHNLLTGHAEVIFEGFVDAFGNSRSFEHRVVTVSIKHWLFVLDAHLGLTSLMHKDSCNVLNQHIYSRTFVSSAQQGDVHENSFGLSWQQSVVSRITNDLIHFQEDAFQYGVRVFLQYLVTTTETKPFLDIVQLDSLAELTDSFALKCGEILASRILGGDSLTENASGTFPRAKFQAWGRGNDLCAMMSHCLTAIPNNVALLNSIWAMLLTCCSNLSLVVIPRVHEIRVVPKWTAFDAPSIKTVVGALSYNNEWQFMKPVAVSVTIPSSIDDRPITGVQQEYQENSKEQTLTIKDLQKELIGLYIPPGRPTGSLLVTQRTDRIGHLSSGCILGDPGDMKQDITPEEAQPKPDGSTVTQKALLGKSFYDALAEETYWDTALRGRQNAVVLPLRFDLCPGSTVRILVGRGVLDSDVTIPTNSFIGYATAVTMTFDAMSATASTQLQLSHVRSAEEQADMPEKHPIYDCRPFVDASWTKNPLKTVAGS